MGISSKKIRKFIFFAINNKISRTFVEIYDSMITDENLLQRIEIALDTIRPHLRVDGGNVEIVDVTDAHVLRVRWLGNCEGCSMNVMTLRAGIEQAVRAQVPEIAAVEAVNNKILAV